jgi:hypothetical protein
MAETLKSVIVTVADDALPNIQKVAAELATRGMKVSRVMPVTGVIAGSLPTARISAAGEVGGVLSVEEEAVAHLPPSDSTLQ